tara:strand:- start:1018 stop:1224 length:207 start_codon:yes stop_codon:yes gene_type:complete
MSEYIKVEGEENLVRDRSSNAIININTNEIARSRAARLTRTKKDQELQELKSEVTEIKSLLLQLLEKS